MAKAAEGTKDRILSLGKELMQGAGYHAFNYQQISSQMGIRNAAVHYYYPAKEDLGVAIIQDDMASFDEWVKKSEKYEAWDRLDGLLSAYRGYLESGQKLCVISTCAAAYEGLPERMEEAAKTYLNKIIKWMVQVLEDGKRSGEFTFKGESREVAALVGASLPGALQLARFKGEEYFYLVLNQIKQLLKG